MSAMVPHLITVFHLELLALLILFSSLQKSLFGEISLGDGNIYDSLKLLPFESVGAVSYSPSIVTMAVSLTVYEILASK